MYIGAQSIESVASKVPDCDELSWFAARQPAVLRFLGGHLREDSDAFIVALAASWRIFDSYRRTDGVPCPRLQGKAITAAHGAVIREAAEPVSYAGIAERQPELCGFVYRMLADSELLLTRKQEIALAYALWALIYALDEAVTGRPIPLHSSGS